MTRGTREKESAGGALEEPDIAEERLTDRTAANHLALIRLAKLWFAKSLRPALKGFLPTWRRLFGLGLQTDSSTGRKMLAEGVNRPRPGYKQKRLVIRIIARIYSPGISLAGGYPYVELFRQIHEKLCAVPLKH
ncbi:MAG TPA: hypothetical protein VK937_22385 [Candidatus Limnocylindria bacterium]|jgi:hypothetical protein|nr:hypothetical protein [Candidatus Limnocylindria bacterium]